MNMQQKVNAFGRTEPKTNVDPYKFFLALFVRESDKHPWEALNVIGYTPVATPTYDEVTELKARVILEQKRSQWARYAPYASHGFMIDTYNFKTKQWVGYDKN